MFVFHHFLQLRPKPKILQVDYNYDICLLLKERIIVKQFTFKLFEQQFLFDFYKGNWLPRNSTFDDEDTAFQFIIPSDPIIYK